MGKFERYCNAIQEAFRSEDIHFTVKEKKNEAYFILKMPSEKGDDILLMLILHSDECVNFYYKVPGSIPTTSRNAVLEVLNSLNNTYCYPKFMLHDTDTIIADYYLSLCGDEHFVSCMICVTTNLLIRAIEAALPKISKEIWNQLNKENASAKPTRFRPILFNDESEE